ncbi:uncharacterized protein [Rutidosis leptorrhynchoides]|uniref:uncharacterized protein n=1 Tax=Rutidosis leptorrhynchoides TaxID=125765 RepID=UPI003A9965FF
MDYFTKWAEAKPLKNNREAHRKVRMGTQRNGQVEVTNKDLIKGIEKRLGRCHQGWVEELPLLIWGYRTTPKRSNRETPFSLAYGTEAVLPTEIQVLSTRTANTEDNEENLRLNLDLVEEIREAALI